MQKKVTFVLILVLFFSSIVNLYAFQELGTNERNFIYLKNNQGNEIRVFEDGGNYFQNFPLPKDIKVSQMAVCPCGGFILAFDESKKTVYYIDDENGDVIWALKHMENIGSMTVSKHKTRYIGITNTVDHSIRVYSEKGVHIRTIKNDNRWKEATAISIDDWNHVWVVDKVGKSVFMLTEKGNVRKKTSYSSSTPFSSIVSLSSNRSGDMYVLDTNGKIYVFSRNGKYSRSTSIKNSQGKPNSIGIDPTLNYMYVQYSNGGFSRMKKSGEILYTVKSPFSVAKKDIIQLQIGSRLLLHYGVIPVVLDAAPFIDSSSNRTYVPIRAITESFGANVSWNGKEQSVTILLQKTKIILKIGSKKASVNGKQISLDAPPSIVSNRTFVPLRFISEALGANVQWFAENRIIKIVK
ncbi:MAG: hypothetical protein KAH01_00060 [Caldisericia bacterium]|nr:hypothetical protein [Caldisericia bacterium]